MENTTKFLIFCSEIYKDAYNLNGKELVKLFDKYKIFDYIISCYGALHTTGPQYIIEDITGLINDRKKFDD
jgi:hypothetical protein